MPSPPLSEAHDHRTQTSPPPHTERPPTSRRRGRAPEEISQETREEIIRLRSFYGSRKIAPRVQLGRKLVRRVLDEAGLMPPVQPQAEASKLDPFREQIESRVRVHLTTTRIHREIAALGYDGGRTILAQLCRDLRNKLTTAPRKKVKRRFETGPGREMQIDWSPYLVPVGGRPVKVHALGCLLACSRKLFVRFYRDERQSTLLEGLACAFEYFDGAPLRLVLDNMATAVLGRTGPEREPLWHPRFLDFVRHYGVEPFACRVRDPDRKGKKEKSFRLLEDDFLRGSAFSSWEDLHERLRVWLDETPSVANLRIHGTTRLVPNEVFTTEHPFLIRLPAHRCAVHEEGVRFVDQDATLSIHGTPYTVPTGLASRSVAVRLYAEHFEVLDREGRIAFSRRYVDDAHKGRLVIDPTHYANLPRRPHGDGGVGGERLDDAFVRRFPTLSPLVDGLKRRMKTLAHVHLRALLRSAERYGEPAFLVAAQRSQEFRRFDALAVERILERTCPVPDEPVASLGGHGPAALGEVEPGSLDDYAALDGVNTTKGDHHGS
jgi:transposase